MDTTRTTVVGVFEDRRLAQQAVDELKRAGFSDDEIGVATRREEGERTYEGEEESYAGEGAVAGAVAGAGIGGLWAIGIAAGVLPVIGPVIAGGLLASILASAAAGAAIGGLAGALIGLGIPEEEAEYYESEFKAGRTIVTVKTAARYSEAREILRRNGAYDHENRTADVGASLREDRRQEWEDRGERREDWATTRGVEAAGQTVRARQEELRPRKESVETGEVRVHKEVHTEQRTIDVPVEREEVVVERRPASGMGGEIREGEEIRVPVREEQVHVEKQPVVTEEVTVGKRKVRDTERVADTVRKEEIRVEKEGDVNVRDEGR
jgi:uncharacterized protein (TIGR02271 family)